MYGKLKLQNLLKLFKYLPRYLFYCHNKGNNFINS